MNEPKRWLDEGAPEAIGRMLRAAGDERPSPTALERALAGVAVGAGISGAGVAVAGAAVKGAPLASGVFLKWTMLGTLVTLGSGGLAVGISSLSNERAAAPASATSSAPSGPRLQVMSTQPAPPAPASSAASTGTVAKAPGNAGREPRRDGDPPPRLEPVDVIPMDAEVLAQETKLVDRARAELTAGQPAQALVALDEYQARFPRPRYAPEALYLRMEALLLLGNEPAARQVATRLAASHPNSPHAARAEAVLSTTIP